MFGLDCDIAFRAKFALELIQKRISTGKVSSMYKLIMIDKSLNEPNKDQNTVIDEIRKLVSQHYED